MVRFARVTDRTRRRIYGDPRTGGNRELPLVGHDPQRHVRPDAKLPADRRRHADIHGSAARDHAEGPRGRPAPSGSRRVMADRDTVVKDGLRATLADLAALHGAPGFEQPVVRYFDERVQSLVSHTEI